MTTPADPQKGNHRNANGVKSSSDMWRTFGGAHYVCWLICPSAEIVVVYRASGIRCRRVGEHLFVHQADRARASAIDAARGD